MYNTDFLKRKQTLKKADKRDMTAARGVEMEDGGKR